MPTSIALLRGINVGGKTSLPMADLRSALEDAGYENVATYIQSGNVVFDHPKRSTKQLEADLERVIARFAERDVVVVARSARELAAVEQENPFPKADPSKLHVAFLKIAPPRGAERAIDAAAFDPEELAVRGREIYLHLPGGMGRSKLAEAALKAVRVPATVRNWRTLTKLADMAAGR